MLAIFGWPVELRVGPGPNMTLLQFVEKIVSGEISYIWNVPQPVRETCLPALKKWSEDTLDLKQLVPIPKELRWTIYRKQ